MSRHVHKYTVRYLYFNTCWDISRIRSTRNFEGQNSISYALARLVFADSWNLWRREATIALMLLQLKSRSGVDNLRSF